MDDRVEGMLRTVRAPDVDRAFVARLHDLPLPAVPRSLFDRAWWRYLVPLPVTAALAGLALGLMTAPPPEANQQTIDLAVLIGGEADTFVVELMEDILWPYDSPVTLASY